MPIAHVNTAARWLTGILLASAHDVSKNPDVVLAEQLS